MMAVVKVLYKCCCRNVSENEQKYCGKNANCEDLQNETFQCLKVNNENSISAASVSQIDRIKNSPKLQIKILESSVLAIGSVVNVNCAGVENSIRGKFDGLSFFGSKLRDCKSVVNDFVVDEESKGFGAQHFVIRYEEEKQVYLVSDLGCGTGTFIRVGSEMLLKHGNIVSFGTSHMAVYFSSQMSLILKFLEGSKSGSIFKFDPSTPKILIGRTSNCNILFTDNTTSRTQCTLSFTPNKGWSISDGHNTQKSTNGTWLFIEKDFEIFEGLTIKAGKTLFQVHIL